VLEPGLLAPGSFDPVPGLLAEPVGGAVVLPVGG